MGRQERRASRAFWTYRCACLSALVFPGLAIIASRIRGVETCSEQHLYVLLLWGLPTTLAALAAEVCHCVLFACLLPLRLAFQSNLQSADAMNSILLGFPASTMQRAMLGNLRVQAGLPNMSILSQVFLSVGPPGLAFVFRTSLEKVLPLEIRDSLIYSMIVHIIALVVFFSKVLDLEELLGDIRETLREKQLLLRSSFDATCSLTVEDLPFSGESPKNRPQKLPGAVPLQQQMERLGLTVAGQLRVFASSNEMDTLFGEAMGGRVLDQVQVSQGLEELTELVTRVGQGLEIKGNSLLLSCSDKEHREFELEVRVVAQGGGKKGRAMCGLRCMGEKRLHMEEVLEAQEMDHEKSPTRASANFALGRIKELWAWLRADAPAAGFDDSPQLRVQPPAAQAVWRALRRMPDLMAVWCRSSDLVILEATLAANRELLGPLKGLMAQTLLADLRVAQVFKNAAEVTATWNRHAIATEGCYCHDFGTVLLNSSRALGLSAAVDFIALPGHQAAAPSLVVVFHPNRQNRLRSCLGSNSVRSSELLPEDSASNAAIRARPRRWGIAKSVSWAGDDLE